MTNIVKDLWAEYSKTKNRDILVRIGEIARAEQIRQSHVALEARTKKCSVRDRRHSRTDRSA